MNVPNLTYRHRSWLILGSLIALLVMAACSPQREQPTTQTVIPSASVGETAGLYQSGMPSSDAAAPTAEVTGNTTIIPGGSATFTVTAPEEFTQLFLWLEGLDGYYAFDVPAGTSQRVVVSLGSNLAELLYNFGFAVGTGNGAGDPATVESAVEVVGTGDVQVSVSWDSRADVDLYLVEPGGNEIYYGNRSSTTGGTLDLDSNAACGGADLRNENITYEDAVPPAGEYTVRVNYWSNCTVDETNYVVTVRVAGQATRVFTGRYTGNGAGGGRGAGEVVTTFTYNP